MGSIAQFLRYKEYPAALTGTALTVAGGTIKTKTLTGATTFTDALESGESLTLHLSAGASYVVTWPTITWVGATAPDLTAADVLEFWKVGTTLYGVYVGSVA